MDREELVRLVVAEVERRLNAAPSPVTTLALVEPAPGLAAALPPQLPTLPEDPDYLEREVLPGLETLLLPCLRPGSAARIALGLDNNTVPRLVHAALWAGKRVIVTPGWSPEAGNAGYRALYDGYLERLRSFGIEVTGAPEPTVAAPVTWEQRLLTEADVLALAGRGISRLLLPAGALATPLAHDAARSRGIVLERR